MTWLAENWFWVLIFIAFIAMHIFGHGGHGGHRGHGEADRQRSADETGDAQGGVANRRSGAPAMNV